MDLRPFSTTSGQLITKNKITKQSLNALLWFSVNSFHEVEIF